MSEAGSRIRCGNEKTTLPNIKLRQKPSPGVATAISSVATISMAFDTKSEPCIQKHELFIQRGNIMWTIQSNTPK